jgi:hypothetical protein
MGKETTTTVVWTCDRCNKRVESPTQPASPADPWGTISIVQPAGYDMQGVPWVTRMRDPLLMCGACIEDVVSAINSRSDAAAPKERVG